jgi:REP element-mobilizing transposase RayT
MDHSSKRYHRRSIRLKGYDDTQPGAYFVTLCTHDRVCLFGEVVEGQMRLNELGEIVCQCWLAIPDHFPQTALDAFVIMPNHVHGILWIVDAATDDIVGATHASPLQLQPLQPQHPTSPLQPQYPTLPLRLVSSPGPKRQSIGAIVGSFKSAASKRINERRGTPGAPVWQRNYYEHIIRSEDSLARIREYIAENPLRWHLDRENPQAVGEDDLWNRLFV